MIRNIIKICCVMLMLCGQVAVAGSGLLFNLVFEGNILNINTTVFGHTYPNAGIKIKTPDYTLTNPGVDCVVDNNGYCLFSVSDTVAATIGITGRGGNVDVTLCLNAQDPISCQRFSKLGLQIAYVVNNNNFAGNGPISACPVLSGGSFANCTDVGDDTLNFTNQFNDPRAIALNPTNKVAYIANFNSTTPADSYILVCPISASGLSFASPCTQNFPFNYSEGGLTVSPNGNFLYISNYENSALTTRCLNNKTQCVGSVEKCTFNSDGTINTCVDSGAGSGPFDAPIGVTLNRAGTVAYVTNDQGNSVTICSVDPLSGDFSSCHDSIATLNQFDAFQEPIQVALYEAANLAYITNYKSGTVTMCTLTNNGLNFSNCQDSGAAPPTLSGLNNPDFGGGVIWGLSLNIPQAVAYISDETQDTVWACQIGTGGFLNICNQLNDGTFTGTGAIALAG